MQTIEQIADEQIVQIAWVNPDWMENHVPHPEII